MTPMTDAFNLLGKLAASDLGRGLDRIADRESRAFETLERKVAGAFDALEPRAKKYNTV